MSLQRIANLDLRSEAVREAERAPYGMTWEWPRLTGKPVVVAIRMHEGVVQVQRQPLNMITSRMRAMFRNPPTLLEGDSIVFKASLGSFGLTVLEDFTVTRDGVVVNQG